MQPPNIKARYHLPGLFEFYEFYKIFLPLFFSRSSWFYPWCEIGSIYGAPADCIWGGGRAGFGQNGIERQVLSLCQKYGISPRLTFSNSLLKNEHLADQRCNKLCALFGGTGGGRRTNGENTTGGKNLNAQSGIIIHSDLLLEYLKDRYPEFYFVSSTTKVLTGFDDFCRELNREDFKYVVCDFRLNRQFEKLNALPPEQKDKVEFLCNECCWFECTKRYECYENVSRKVLGQNCPDHQCAAPNSGRGYVFSAAMKNPGFLSVDDIKNVYMPMGFTNFKIEGRSLGSALILEFILYYMTRPEHQLEVREQIYLDNTLDLF